VNAGRHRERRLRRGSQRCAEHTIVAVICIGLGGTVSYSHDQDLVYQILEFGLREQASMKVIFNCDITANVN
jgi:hypothetical protein